MMNGRKTTVASAATSKALASSTRIATRGRASCPTCVPNWLTVSADHSLRKSGCRQSPPVGQSLGIELPRGQDRGRVEERERERMHIALRALVSMEVRDEAVEPALEALDVLLGEPHVHERGRVLLDRARCDHLVGGMAEHDAQ